MNDKPHPEIGYRGCLGIIEPGGQVLPTGLAYTAPTSPGYREPSAHSIGHFRALRRPLSQPKRVGSVPGIFGSPLMAEFEVRLLRALRW